MDELFALGQAYAWKKIFELVLYEIIPRNIAGGKVGHPSRGERAIDLSASTHIIANALNTASTSMLRSGLFDELKRMCAIHGKGDAPRSGR